MANDTPSPTVPIATLAKLFNLTNMRIQQLTKMGVTIRADHGRYDLWPSVKGYIGYLQDRTGARAATSEEGADDYTKHRSRLTKAKADHAELDVALAKGRVHDAEAVALVWDDMLTNSRSRILSIPPKCAPLIVGMSDVNAVQDILEQAVNDTLNELSNYDPSRIARQALPDDQPSMEGSVETDSQPME